MTKSKAQGRITDALLNQILGDADPTELFQSGELLAEMDEHLSQSAAQDAGNVRNGHNAKTVLTDSGSMPLEVPRDRQGTFEPQLIEKYARRLPGFDDKVIHLFAHGMSTRRIREMVRELYGIDVSADLIARVIDAVLEEFSEWQNRPLADTYAIVYLDAIHVKVREAGAVTTRAVYLAIGIDETGHKAVLGLWLGEREGAKFWLTVLQEFRMRGLKDILIAVVDGLKGFPEALETAFPNTTVQTCIVHLIRHSLSSSSYQERKQLAAAFESRFIKPKVLIEPSRCWMHLSRVSWGCGIRTWCARGGSDGLT